MKKYLMCEPLFFGLKYSINPWMDLEKRVDNYLASSQWEHLYFNIAKRANVALMQQMPSCPDQVFTANAGLIYQNKVVVSNFKYPERKVEEPHFLNWFKNRYELLRWPEDIYFEGAGDALFDSNGFLWVASGFRSDKKAAGKILDLLDIYPIALKLIDCRFYHLDTCFCPLSDGYYMIYRDAFDEDSLFQIDRYIAPFCQIHVSEADALNFACNAVEIDKDVIMNDFSDELAQKLIMRNFFPVKCPTTEFLKAGGGPKCLTLELQ